MTNETAIELLESYDFPEGSPQLTQAAYMGAAALRLSAPRQKPVRYGCWNGEGDGYADGKIVYDVWVCSECGYSIDDGTDNPELLPHYCPHCGAKMDDGPVPASTPRPSGPLTLDELREMDGEPVWVVIGKRGYYDVFCGVSTDGIAQFYRAALPIGGYGKTWLACRRKPKEGK